MFKMKFPLKKGYNLVQIVYLKNYEIQMNNNKKISMYLPALFDIVGKKNKNKI